MDKEYLIKNGVNVEKSLELFGDLNTYNETVGEFIISSEEKLKKLRAYKDAKDINNYQIYIHSLASDAKTFGFTELIEIASAHDEQAKLCDIYYIHDHFDELEQSVEKYKNIISNYLSGNTKTAVIPDKLDETEVEDGGYTRETILVVDDSNIVRNFVKRIFSEKYDVGIAEDGRQAIEIIEENKNNNKIIAILLDLNMPRVDGFAVLDYMKEDDLFKTIPVSIITGDSSKETIDKAFKYKIIDMLNKPFTENEVRRVVEKTIHIRDK